MAYMCYKCFGEYEQAGPCPYCGYEPKNERRQPLALGAGCILGGRYIVGPVLGQGGFGITYIAQDYDSKALVAIKEHFPSSIVTRTGRNFVSIIDEKMGEAFEEGKEKFLEEAKTLSQFNGLDSICDIYSYFEENGTAYFAMEYFRGVGLDDYIKKLGRLPSFEEATRLLLPVMEALSHVHEKGIIHRDISPDNIMVSSEGKVMLIDFGAARYSMGEKSRSLDVILKHGFAPREQYNRHGRQGAYTDVYAMAATYYYTLTGKLPPDALDRLDEDRLIPPTKLGIKMPRRAEQALLKALAVNANQRWQSMREFAEALKKELPPDKRELERQKQLRLEREKKKQAELEEKKRQEEEARRTKQREREELKRCKSEEKQAAKTKAEAKPSKNKKPAVLIAALLALTIGAGVLFAMDSDKAESPAVVSETPAPEASAQPEGVYWELSDDGTLYIKGDGDMENYKINAESMPPWNEHRDSIRAVDVSHGITSVGNYAFWNLRYLERVSLPATLTKIGYAAFFGCQSLKSVDIPAAVATLGSSSFEACSALEKITFGRNIYPNISLTEIRLNTFKDCAALKSIVIPEGVTSIESRAFAGCYSLSDVCFPDSLLVIRNGAFNGCDSLTSVVIPPNLETLEYASINSRNLETVYYCGTEEQWKELRRFHPGQSVEDAEKIFMIPGQYGSAGEKCTWTLFEDNSLHIRGAWKMAKQSYRNAPWHAMQSRIYSVIIGEGLTSIAVGAFAELPYLDYVRIPDSMTIIDQNAFSGCTNLDTVSLPATLSTIRRIAFHDCGLYQIEFRGSEEQWNRIIIESMNEPVERAWIKFNSVDSGE